MPNLKNIARLFVVNKYAVVIIAGLLTVCLFDSNSVLKSIQLQQQINVLKSQISVLQAQYDKDSGRLRELMRSPGSIAKIARERYFMKTPDEDIFVLSDDEKEEE